MLSVIEVSQGFGGKLLFDNAARLYKVAEPDRAPTLAA